VPFNVHASRSTRYSIFHGVPFCSGSLLTGMIARRRARWELLVLTGHCYLRVIPCLVVHRVDTGSNMTYILPIGRFLLE
jgi:hypothetical protein